MTESILAIVAIFIVGISLLYVIKELSDYYVTKYHFSLWCGVLLMSVAVILMILITGASQMTTVHFLVIIASGLVLFTLIQDIRLSSIGMGIVAFIVQFLLTISLFAIILTLIARWIMNKAFGKGNNWQINSGVLIGLHSGEPFRYFFTISHRS